MSEKTLLTQKTYLPPLLRTVRLVHDLSMMASSKTIGLEDFEEETVISD
ncbi:MAG: hypothetical protein IJM35_10830 [Bacteroidales bacterium]|nr:hypothetical protein [Bacteroidales bacterium]